MKNLEKMSYNDLRKLAVEMGVNAKGKAEEIRERIEAKQTGNFSPLAEMAGIPAAHEAVKARKAKEAKQADKDRKALVKRRRKAGSSVGEAV